MMKHIYRGNRLVLLLVFVGIIGAGLMTTGTNCCPTGLDSLYDNALESFSHDLSAGGHHNQACTACHHVADGTKTDATGKACALCHNPDEVVGGIPVLKDVMHSSTGGCRACHNQQNEDGTWDCSFCHSGA
ncbi:MAG: hypothetical protein JXQ75_21435 [Phycisphaerae bacterium]|nr:hypothetical protein [Phycisphaerae bacterium]